VSILLDNRSVRITEQHYAPWVRSRQEQLEADLANAWSRDPLVLLQSGVHQRYTPSGAPTTHLSSISKDWCPGWESNPHEEKSPEDFKSSASAIPPPGQRAETKHSTVFAFFRVRGSGKCAALLARLRSLVKPKPKRLGGNAPRRAVRKNRTSNDGIRNNSEAKVANSARRRQHHRLCWLLCRN